MIIASERTFNMKSWYRKLTTVMGAISLVVSTLTLGALSAPVANAQVSGLTVDFASAEPTSYNHLIGGGQWQSGDVNKHIARSLTADKFNCGDIVSYLTKYATDQSLSITGIEPFQVRSEYSFDLDTTGQSGAILGDVIGVTIDTTDPAQVGNGDSVATLVSETASGPLFTKGSKLVALVDVSNLDRNEVVIVRMDVKIICDPKLRPTGDLQARLKDAVLISTNGGSPVLPPEPVGVGEKTVPLKKLNALAIPQLSIVKSVVSATSTCPGTKSLTVLSGEAIKYCYAVLNVDGGGTNPPAPIYDLSPITDDGGQFDAFTVFLTGLSDQDGDGNADDLAPGATALGEAVKTYEVTDDTTILNTATVFGYDSIINPIRLDATDSATLTVVAPALVPSISIDKLTNGADGVTVLVDGLVVWSYQLINTGNAPLSNISVVDDKGVTVTCPQTTLAVGQSITCDASGTAIKGPYTNTATVSASFGATTVSATDSSSYFGADPTMTLVKLTNGVDGANIAVGASVTWTYLVTNTGNVAIDSISVDDNLEGAIACPKSTLAVGEAMTCTKTGVAIAGEYENLGTARANFQGTSIIDQDSSSYYGVLAALTLDKTTNGQDGGNIIKFSPVEWRYLVTNTGNVPLSNIVVLDDQGVTVICPQGFLPPGTAMTCIGAGIAGEGPYSNTGTVTGENGPFTASASDSSNYFGARVELTLKKFTNGAEAPDINVGNAITWTYLVTNTGNVTVSSIAVVDDQGVSVSCPKSELVVDEEMTCSGTGVATAGWYRNLGTATGTFEQTNVIAQDSSTYFGSSPSVTLDKLTNGSDNPTIPVGSPVVWTYQVTNTGNVPIDTIAVTDNQGVTVTCPMSTLAVGEFMQCSANGTATAGAYSNIGTVVANYLGLQVSASDGSSYFGSAPSVDIQKTPDSQVVTQGATATFTITVTNTGNVPLNSVVISDPLAPACDRTFPSLAVGEAQSYTCSLANLQATMTNVVTIVANTGTTLISDSDAAEVTVDFLPDVTLSKIASPTTVPAIGGLVDYTLRITNSGVDTVTITSLTDDKVPLSPACAALVGQVIAPGAFLECVIPAVSVIWAGESTLTNTATVIARDPEQNSDTATASATVAITAPAPSIDVQKSPDTQTVVQGGDVTFSITITNTGNVPLSNVVVTDPLSLSCERTIANLAIAEVVTFTCSKSDIQGSFTNVATVTANFGQTPITDQDSAAVVVSLLPDITLSKTASVSTVPATGGLVDYTLRVTNVGPQQVTLTSLSDNEVALSPACISLIGQTIAAGSFLQCVIPGVFVTWTGEAVFTNTASASAQNPEQLSDTATASATVTFGWYGRTPGFWKNRPQAWISGYTPNQNIQDIFAIPTRFLKSGVLDIITPSGKDRLIDGLSYRGGTNLDGSFQILMRAAIAALLNEAYYGDYYPGATSTAALITQINGVLALENRSMYLALATTLDGWNNAIHQNLP